MELKRIFDLCDEVEEILETARLELTQLVDVVAGGPAASSKSNKKPARTTLSNNPHKTVDQLLWKAEVRSKSQINLFLVFIEVKNSPSFHRNQKFKTKSNQFRRKIFQCQR